MNSRATDRPQRWRGQLADGRQVSVLVRPTAINLLLNQEEPSFTFDPAGRLHGAFWRGVNYRRSLDNRVLSKWRNRTEEGSRRQRRWLTTAEARELIEKVYQLARETTNCARQAVAAAAIQEGLARLSRWDWDALEADRRRFQQIYTPVGILPPDQYLALVLQATHGCSHNACTFCTFYRGQPFRIKSPEEFRRHVAAVLDFFGPALAMRRSLFLADANALVIPMPRLLALLDVLTEYPSLVRIQSQDTFLPPSTSDLPSPSFGRQLPIFAFIDAFHVHRKSVAEWQELKARGLRRVYIGMESGHDPLLRWLNKPGSAADVLEAVVRLKQAELQASVIIMLGVGGDRYADGHVADTVALLNAMPLTRGDIIYFSDFVELPGAAYTALAVRAGIRPLTPREKRAQELAIRSQFKPWDPARPPQFSHYDIEEFIY